MPHAGSLVEAGTVRLAIMRADNYAIVAMLAALAMDDR
jgi:hypothetical protein